ncbi:MAG: activase, partial [Candidatus Marinimicrobia bacterium]|nr:activase [Candidatus Neomarinimicrobiota bacterium]
VKRQEMVFKQFAPDQSGLPDDAPVIGLSRSFLMNTYYPLFAHFFNGLGFRTVIPDTVDERGVDLCAAPFCYPCEIAHGYLYSLLLSKPRYIILPHIKGTPVENGYEISSTCPLLQGEPYYLKLAFESQLENGPEILAPVLDLSAGPKERQTAFLTMARQLGVGKAKAAAAYEGAYEKQDEMEQQMLEIGRETLKWLEEDPSRIGIVLAGRPYSAFSPDANKGIPHKFASRGITVIPVDFLDLAHIPAKEHMYWAAGQTNLKGAEFIKTHPQLFGTFITNFSCGPDSFVLGYFKNILGRKPSLILELDNHTADAGIETRIEAFLDIISRYRSLEARQIPPTNGQDKFAGIPKIKELRSDLNYKYGPEISLFDPRLRVLFSSMGQYSTRALAAVYRSFGIKTAILPAMNEEDLKLGRGNSTCKECLPLQLTTGSLLKYLRDERPDGEVTAYFMPTADGPCRFGQYQDYLRDFIEDHKLHDVTILTISASDSYGGLGTEFIKQSW